MYCSIVFFLSNKAWKCIYGGTPHYTGHQNQDNT